MGQGAWGQEQQQRLPPCKEARRRFITANSMLAIEAA